ADPEERIMKSVYGATRLHLGEDLKFILGANYTEIETLDYKKNKVSPYAGIKYNFTPEYTGYMSYTSIFRPQTVIDLSTKQTAVPVEGES
ncbi:TonB-dependent receptor, partial [Acinetobacter baumannii]